MPVILLKSYDDPLKPQPSCSGRPGAADRRTPYNGKLVFTPKSAKRTQQAVHPLLNPLRYLQIERHRPAGVGHCPHNERLLDGCSLLPVLAPLVAADPLLRDGDACGRANVHHSRAQDGKEFIAGGRAGVGLSHVRNHPPARSQCGKKRSGRGTLGSCCLWREHKTC